MSQALRLTVAVVLSVALSPRLEPGLALGPSRALAQEEQLEGMTLQSLPRRLLGQSRQAVEGLVAALPADDAEGWVRYGADLSIRYEGGRCVRLRVKVPDRLSCGEAATWVGYPMRRGSGFPLRRPGRCEWPGQSSRHRLGRGVAGALDLPSGVFELWLLPTPGAPQAAPAEVVL